MKIIEHNFTAEEVSLLKKYSKKQKDARLENRFIAMILIAKNNNIEDVAHTVSKNVKTINKWLYQYINNGVEALSHFQYKPKRSYLTSEQITQLIAWVRENNPSVVKEVREYIIDNFNVFYDQETVRKLLKKNGLRVIRPKTRPGNTPTVEEQNEFIKNYNELKNNRITGSVILFEDGMHLIHQNIPGLCWGDPKHPPVLQTNSGRKRLNILGAYNPVSYSLVHLTGEENCDADRVIEFFELILRKYSDAPQIHLILDNASYNHAKKVTDWLKEHSALNLIFLPSYAPNLNLIERLWRLAKKHLVRNNYCNKYKAFRAKTFYFLNHLDDYIDELKTLMVEDFQIIMA